LTATITPSAASSKVLIYVNMPNGGVFRSASGTNNIGTFRLVRASTNINDGRIASVNHPAVSGYQINHTATIIHLDSPNTTAATAYKVQGKTDATLYFNGLVDENIASIILLEIGA